MIPTGTMQKNFLKKPLKVDNLLSIPKTMWILKVTKIICIGYKIKQDECDAMVKAYVNDISQFLDVANR
jgi:hypothetical protein